MERNLRREKRVNHTICAWLGHAVCSPGFGLAVAGTVAAVFFGGISGIISAFQSEEWLAAGFHKTLLMDSLHSEVFLFMLPILSGIPYSASYIDDRKSGFVKACLARSARRDYLAGKVFACMAAGGLSLLCGIFVSLLFFKIIFSPMELAAELQEMEGIGKGWWRELVNVLLSVQMAGAFWSFVGMALSVLTSSRYMAYGGAFIVYYVLILLQERYFPKLYALCPKEWLFPQNIPYDGIWIALLYLELWLLLFFFFERKA